MDTATNTNTANMVGSLTSLNSKQDIMIRQAENGWMIQTQSYPYRNLIAKDKDEVIAILGSMLA